MKYPDGSDARLGDRVRIVNGDTGVIVASMDTHEFSPEYPAENYAHLKAGILILTDRDALVRFEEPADSNIECSRSSVEGPDHILSVTSLLMTPLYQEKVMKR